MTKKRLLFALSLGILLPTLTLSPTAYAASDAECSIWLCLPTGFPSGCGDAKSAFKKRIKKFKPPLPSFTSCLLKDSPKTSDMSAGEGVAAKMPDGSYIDGNPCIIIRNRGEITHWSPKGCIDTWYFVDTYLDGEKYGDRYYYQR